MRFAFFPYRLQPVDKPSTATRQGALLRIAFPDGAIGYGDCHPWIEFGAIPVDEQLRLLSEGKTTSITEQSLHFAKIDADARRAGHHLFHGLEVPESHHLITNLTAETLKAGIAKGQRLFKIKMGRSLADEVSILHDCYSLLKETSCQLRLDFNELLTETQFAAFLKAQHAICELIDFAEDPFPYDPERWHAIRQRYNIPLACDVNVERALKDIDTCDFLVIKPAIQQIEPFLTTQRGNRPLVITTCLDHPIGQLGAAYVAAIVARDHPYALSTCGLLSHEAYEVNPFSERLEENKGHLKPWLQGSGWGYDDILELIAWQVNV